ncbi:unnamed protein product [Mucor hiemalis]
MSETLYLFHSKSKKSSYLSTNNNHSSSSKLIMTTAKEVQHDEYHIHWRLHFLWTVAVICFIFAKLWWLVPLPGPEVMPAYRTYPANFLDTLFLTFGCALVARSVVVGLVKSFSDGIYPESIIAFGPTGGFGAMWSCIRHRSGIRYFLIAMMVTACTLLGNALAGELQSSVRIYYREGGSTSSYSTQCQHTSPTDFNLASSAYSAGLITNTLSDAAPLLNSLSVSQPMKSFSVSLIKSSFTPIQNVAFPPPQSSTTRILRRHHPRPSPNTTKSTQTQQATEIPCSDEKEGSSPSTENNDNASISDENSAEGENLGFGATNDDCNHSSTTTNNNITSVTTNGTSSSINNGNNSNNGDKSNNGSNIDVNTTITSPGSTSSASYDNATLIISSAVAAEAEALAFNSSKLVVMRGGVNNMTVMPFQLDQINNGNNTPVKLNVLRYTTPDNKEAVIIYSSASEGYKAGIYVSATATNYTCQSRGGSVMCDEGRNYAADSRVIADAMVAAIRSGEGLYGTNSGNGIPLDIVNGVYNEDKNSKLADALFANPLCSSPEISPAEGVELYPYSVGRMTPLVILWLVLFAILWLIGIYLIGYSEHTWTELATTGNLVPQIISKSPNMFEDNELGAKTVRIEMFLDPEEGKMNFAKVHRHGYTVTTAEVET